jgi:hypothetical protein
MIRICWFVVVLTMAGACAGQAAIITFDFTGVAPGQHSPWTTTSAIDSNVTLTTGFSTGSGLTGNTGDDRFNARGWTSPGTATLADSISGNDYVYFVITPNNGCAIDLNSATITFTLQTSLTGPNNYTLMDSINGFSDGNQLQNGSGIANTTTSLSYTYGSTGNDNISGTIEFRIYGYDASGGTGTMSVNALSLGGSITAVPEPAAWGAIFGACSLALCGGRVWRQRRPQNRNAIT